eukprot:scaffold7250_cov131-Cylindrotheca_fusiformis.AAC.3
MTTQPSSSRMDVDRIDSKSDSMSFDQKAVSSPPSDKEVRIPFRIISVGNKEQDGEFNDEEKKQIRLLLRNLRSSTSLKDAMDAMAGIRQPLASNQDTDGNDHVERRQSSAERVANANGTAAILMALKEWQSSQGFVNLALRALIQITCFVPKTRKLIVESGGVRTILAASKLHPRDYSVNASTMGLLNNLSLHHSTRFELGTENCIEFVIETMQTWPDDLYSQKCGCFYLRNICGLKDARKVLHKKQVGILLATVMDNSYVCDAKGETFRAAKEAMETYLRRVY